MKGMKALYWIVGSIFLLAIIPMFYTPAPLPPVSETETFVDVPACPTSATRDSEGRIHVKPGHHVFRTIQEYVQWLSGVYSHPKNATCIPPMVRRHHRETSPIDGILGGLGTGTESAEDVGRQGVDRTVLNTGKTGSEWANTSAQTPIDSLNDYEYSRIFQLERQPRNNPLTKEIKDKLLSQRVLDWASLPFNSEARAEKEDEFVAGRMESEFRDPKTGVFFSNMEGKQVLPPDEEALRLKEQAILASYRPSEISQHVVDSEMERVAQLVHKVYENDPNWEPVVEKTGEHQYSVVELKPKPRKEKWADDNTVQTAISDSNEPNVINPTANIQIYDRHMNDPYFDKQGIQDADNDRFWAYHDFNKWTPGLERMFAPTAETKAWY